MRACSGHHPLRSLTVCFSMPPRTYTHSCTHALMHSRTHTLMHVYAYALAAIQPWPPCVAVVWCKKLPRQPYGTRYVAAYTCMLLFVLCMRAFRKLITIGAGTADPDA